MPMPKQIFEHQDEGSLGVYAVIFFVALFILNLIFCLII